MANNLLQLSQFVQQGFDQGEAKGKANNLARLTAQFAGGADPNYEGIAQSGGDPMAFKKQALDQLGQAAQWFAQLPPEQQAQQYGALAQHATQLGFPVPQQFDPAFVPKIAQLASMITGQADPFKPMNLSPGGEIVDPRTGQVLHSNTNFAPQRPVWDSVRGGWVIPPQSAPNAAPAGNPSPSAALPNVQFDFAPGTSPEIQAAIRAAAAADQAQDPAPGPSGGGFIPVVPPREHAPQAPAEFERKAAYLRAHGVPEDQITQMVMGGSSQGAAPVPGDTTKTGNDYLATLPPQMRGIVKAIAEGQQAPPSSSSRSPQAQALLQAVYAYDPSANASNLPARTQTRKDFTSGKSAQNLRSLNQAIGHLGLLHSQIDGTAGHNFQTLNQLENAIAREAGRPGITNYEQTASALAGELTQVFRGNAGAEADLTRNLQQLSSAQSKDQKLAAVRNIVGLLNSRIEELGQQYSQGMGKTTDPYSLLNKHALEVLQTVAPNVEVANLPPTNNTGAPKIIRYDAQGNRIP